MFFNFLGISWKEIYFTIHSFNQYPGDLTYYLAVSDPCDAFRKVFWRKLCPQRNMNKGKEICLHGKSSTQCLKKWDLNETSQTQHRSIKS